MNIIAKSVSVLTVAAFCAVGYYAPVSEYPAVAQSEASPGAEILAHCQPLKEEAMSGATLADPVYNPTSVAR